MNDKNNELIDKADNLFAIYLTIDEIVITKMALDEFRNAVPEHIDNARKLTEWRADKEMWQKDLMSVSKQLADVLAEDFDNHYKK